MKKLTFILAITLFTNTAFTAVATNVDYVKVNGLVCDFCAQALEKVFGEEATVDGVDVNLDDKVVVVNYKGDEKLPEARLKTLIENAGYDMVGMTDGPHGDEGK